MSDKDTTPNTESRTGTLTSYNEDVVNGQDSKEVEEEDR